MVRVLDCERADQYARDYAAQEVTDTNITASAEELAPLGTIPAEAGSGMSTCREGRRGRHARLRRCV
jgi:hypothetical protein